MSDGEDAQIYDFFEYKRSKEAQKKQERKRKRNRKPVEEQKAAHPAQMSAETRKSLEATLNEKHTPPKGYTPHKGRKGHLNSSQFGVSMPYNPDNIEIPWTFVPGLGGDQTIPGGIQRPDSDGLDD